MGPHAIYILKTKVILIVQDNIIYQKFLFAYLPIPPARKSNGKLLKLSIMICRKEDGNQFYEIGTKKESKNKGIGIVFVLIWQLYLIVIAWFTTKSRSRWTFTTSSILNRTIPFTLSLLTTAHKLILFNSISRRMDYSFCFNYKNTCNSSNYPSLSCHVQEKS